MVTMALADQPEIMLPIISHTLIHHLVDSLVQSGVFQRHWCTAN
ncbi:MAG: hypothetical protein ACR2HF_03480 [Methylococcaceae bacterium]